MTDATTAEAARYVRRLTWLESSGWGDEAEALKRIARRCKVSFWTLDRLRKGAAKTVKASVLDALAGELIRNCEAHAARLLAEAEAAKLRGAGNAETLDGIEGEIRALAARLEAAASKAGGLLK